MIHQFSSTAWIEQDIRSFIKNKPNSKIKGAFYHLRRMPKYALLGDYPIMFTILSVLKLLKCPTTARDIFLAYRTSEELREAKNRKLLLKQLYENTYKN